jgi:farnesyl-diphosphate farnesyltransferase
MPPRLNQAVSSTYLLLRAIDEIEDHPRLPVEVKARALRGISEVLQRQHRRPDFSGVLCGLENELPDVSLRMGDWASLATSDIAPRIQETVATMSERMASWATAGWSVRTQGDFERYAYAVIGTGVLLLNDLWAWFDGTSVDRTLGIGYARALQALNVYGDREEDLDRGVDLWPDGWTEPDMFAYAQRQLEAGWHFVRSLPEGSPAHTFCHGVLSKAASVLEQTPARRTA